MKRMILPLIIAIVFIGLGIWNCVDVVKEWLNPKELAQLEHVSGKVTIAQELNSAKPRKILFALAGNDKQFAYDETTADFGIVKNQVVTGKVADVWYDAQHCTSVGGSMVCEIQQMTEGKNILVARENFMKVLHRRHYLSFIFYLIISIIGFSLLFAAIKSGRRGQR